MARHSISEFPFHSNAHLPWRRILLLLVGLGLLFAATRTVAAPARSDAGGPASRPPEPQRLDHPRPQTLTLSEPSPSRVPPGVRRDPPALGKPREAGGLVPPRPLPQCKVMPTPKAWKHRSGDILAEIQWMSRRGAVPVVAVPEDAAGIEGYSQFPAGWRAYGFIVPPEGKLHVRLQHPNEAWFNLRLLNKWGGQEKGMVQLPTGNPEVTYANASPEQKAVYILVDDPGWMSGEKNRYTLTVEKSWKSLEPQETGASLATGVWGVRQQDTLKPKSAAEQVDTKG